LPRPWKRQAEETQTTASERKSKAAQPGFDLLVGCPFPLGFFFRILVLFCFFLFFFVFLRFFFVQGGVPAPQEPMEKLSSTGRSALDPFKHGCFYTGQPPDVPMVRF
jgi:hypothetical protein